MKKVLCKISSVVFISGTSAVFIAGTSAGLLVGFLLLLQRMIMTGQAALQVAAVVLLLCLIAAYVTGGVLLAVRHFRNAAEAKKKKP